jgi:hypothetical protein
MHLNLAPCDAAYALFGVRGLKLIRMAVGTGLNWLRIGTSGRFL